MSTAKSLHSIRRLLAFACLLLSLLLVGVGELVLDIDYSGIAVWLVLAGFGATVVTGIWFVRTLLAKAPSDDAPRRNPAGDGDETSSSEQDDGRP
ncbi:hypothetical protein [Halorubellus litoreus]|uniref:Uncharacterized protein n=1 Tax=Halorubellus litoreus TaxID=755308 RepID=A0ABD5V7S0_9EURY